MKLVLFPGLDGTGVLFRPLLQSLPGWLEPVVVTYPTQQVLGYDDLFETQLRSLALDEPFIVLGESFGGPLAIRLAAHKPKGLRGLILCGSFITCPYSMVPKWLGVSVRPFVFRSFPFFLGLQSLLGLYESEEHAALGREAVLQVAPNVFAHRVREIIRVEVGDLLKSCAVPILYMQGGRDRIVPASNLQRIRSLRSDVDVVQIDSGHMILKTRPIESAKAIEAFAKRVLRK